MTERTLRAKREYEALCHTMQSGVAMEMNYSTSSTEPKHLRVGVNSALVDGAALAKLLMLKGVFTEEEYYEAIRDQMKEEVERYQDILSRKLGAKVTLA